MPSILGRMRADPGPLLLIGLVVALTTALLSATGVLVARTSDRALADAVRKSGDQGAVVATFPRPDHDYEARIRVPQAGEKFRAAVHGAQLLLPKRVAAVVEPGIASVRTPPLQLLDAGPGRYLALVYLDGPTGGPGVRYTAGGPPRATVDAETWTSLPFGAPPWPVQVAVSQAAATALGIQPGDRLPAKDERGRPVAARVSGVFVADDPGDPAWQSSALLLHPVLSLASGTRTAAAAALVTSETLPDLQLAVPATDLIERIDVTPRPDALTWAGSSELIRTIVSLKASPTIPGAPVWDSTLDRVLDDGRAQVAAARGQAEVLLLSLLVCALLVLWQATDLLVRRRADSVVLTRERGGSLVEIACELFVESAVCVSAGIALGLLCTRLAVGRAGWAWWVPVPLLAALAAAVMGAALAARASDPRRSPANRTARRVAALGRRLRRLALVLAVLGCAVLSFVALRQRGVLGVDGGGGDPTAASAPMWWAVAGAMLVIGAIPYAGELFLDATRRTSGGGAFFVAARVRDTGARALPLLVLTVTVAQLVFAVALTTTAQRGQAAGALLSVGGDARATLAPGVSATELAGTVGAAPGVRAAVDARVVEAQASSTETAGTVRLVVVNAAAYERLLAASALPDAPQLDRLRDGGDPVPALLLGGAAGLAEDLSVREGDGAAVPLSVVGTALPVQDSVDPVVVVDAATYARAGGVATPNTVWAVGPGAEAAVRAAVGKFGEIVLYSEALAARRGAPLSEGLVRLGTACSALLLLFAVVGVVLAGASEAEPRASSMGRLRALGLRDRQLWGVLAGELLTPVLIGALAGLVLGLGAVLTMFGRLSLERVTGQAGAPDVSVPPWALLSAVVLVVAVLALTHVEWTRLRRVALGELLRGVPPR